MSHFQVNKPAQNQARAHSSENDLWEKFGIKVTNIKPEQLGKLVREQQRRGATKTQYADFNSNQNGFRFVKIEAMDDTALDERPSKEFTEEQERARRREQDKAEEKQRAEHEDFKASVYASCVSEDGVNDKTLACEKEDNDLPGWIAGICNFFGYTKNKRVAACVERKTDECDEDSSSNTEDNI